MPSSQNLLGEWVQDEGTTPAPQEPGAEQIFMYLVLQSHREPHKAPEPHLPP